MIRSERGLSVIELLVAMTLSVLVLGITVTSFTSLIGQDRLVEEHNTAQDQARAGVARLARDLRNLASPTALRTVTENRPRAVERAGPYGLVVRVVDDRPMPAGSLNSANLMRVRWCLDTADTANAKLWVQTQRWTTATPPAVPPPQSCPGPQWDTRTIAASNLSNVITTARPLFTYNSTDLEQINRVHVDLYVDPTPRRGPLETRLSSGVHLRNQNQHPVAAFDVVQVGSSGDNATLRFDGSRSADPESQPLRFCWFVNPPTPTPACGSAPGNPASFIGEGVVVSHSMPPGTHRIVLVVEDPAGLRDEEETQWTVATP